MKGLVLSGGTGTRLRPLTHAGPKQLIPVANKPVLFYGLEALRDAGVTEVGIILGNNMPERVREVVGDGSPLGIRATFIHQGEPRGIAHAILAARDYLGSEPFVVYLGDNILKSGIQAFTRGFTEGRAEARILLTRVRDPQRFGVVELDPRGRVVRLEEKPKAPRSDLALAGIYLLKPSIFPILQALRPSWRNELEITDGLQSLLQSGALIEPTIVDGWWKDTGKPEDILDANRLVLEDLEPKVEGTVEKGAKVSGRVSLGAGSTIHRGSTVRGPAIIGRDCDIAGATLGPYTSIGDNCRIAGATIENSVLVEDIVVETPRRIVESLIGRGSRITSSRGAAPEGARMVVGENTALSL